MGGNVQTYLVQTVYETVDKSSRGVNEISRAMQDAHRHATELRSTLMALGGAFVGGRMVMEAKKAFIDYNSEMEKHKVVLAGMLTMYTGAPIEKSWDRATLSVERFQEMARKSPLTTKELAETAALVTRPLLQAGVKMTQVEQLTFGLANASRAMGISAEVAAMDIEQALTTGVHQRDRFARNLLAQKGIGLTNETFNALAQDKKVETLSRALTSEGITSMAKKQGEDTLSGVLSTLVDNFQIMAGKAGGGVFKGLTEEIKSWNVWIENNSGLIGEMVTKVGDGLIRAFGIAKEIAVSVAPIFKDMLGAVGGVMNFAAEHKDTLITLAKSLLVFKGAQMIGGAVMGGLGMLGGGVGGLAGNFGSMKTGLEELTSTSATLKSAFGGLTAILGGAGGVIGSLAKLSMGAYAVGGLLFGKTESEKKAEAEAKAQILSAQAYAKTVSDVAGVKEEFRKFGVDPNSSRENWGYILKDMGERLDKSSADVNKTEADLIAKGIAAGLISEEITGAGQRRLSLYGGHETTSGLAAADEMVKSLEILFKRKAEQVVAESSVVGGGMDYSLGRWTGRRGGNVWGYYTDTMYHAPKKSTDPDADFVSQKITQNINVTIQRVMAKDPNRWLSELEDEAAKRTRAPTRAKEAWKNSPM